MLLPTLSELINYARFTPNIYNYLIIKEARLLSPAPLKLLLGLAFRRLSDHYWRVGKTRRELATKNNGSTPKLTPRNSGLEAKNDPQRGPSAFQLCWAGCMCLLTL